MPSLSSADGGGERLTENSCSIKTKNQPEEPARKMISLSGKIKETAPVPARTGAGLLGRWQLPEVNLWGGDFHPAARELTARHRLPLTSPEEKKTARAGPGLDFKCLVSDPTSFCLSLSDYRTRLL